MLLRCLALACLVSAAQGQIIESELDGQAANNTMSTSEFINSAFFQSNASPTVFGTLPTAVIQGRTSRMDVDFYSFTAVPGPAWFDIDAAAPGVDTYLALFNANGTLLADNEDSFPPDSGSLSDRDAFLGSITLTGGLYHLAVATSGNFANASFTGSDPVELFRPDGEFGGFAFPGADAGDSSFALSGPQMNGASYVLSISIVPAPGSLALLACGLCGVFRRCR